MGLFDFVANIGKKSSAVKQRRRIKSRVTSKTIIPV